MGNNQERRPGYSYVPIKLLNKIIGCSNLNDKETRIIFGMLYHLYDYYSKQYWTTISKIKEVTKLPLSDVKKSLNSLIKKNVVIIDDEKIYFQKDYKKWKV